MTRKLISSGSTFEKEIGYSRAVVVDNWVLVSGTTGFDYSKMTISDDLLEQAEQCFKNIELALEQAGSSMKDVVRVTYVFPKTEDFEKCWPIMRKYLGDVQPSAMMLTSDLSDPRMKIEIQVTAYRNSN
ncbi:putative aminoacrylate peracid reductase RutC [Nitrosomonas stercoris]|uniref:Putative aminoacrylate peracid reductase RutC n=1 Tax=Nitrosomonas stercoris TaxID=1444684 RepID=A0A4Y1YLW9_9PROT|nr:putative aminoacrylate peracid reductase RutC [Nitrosomonas stercoris]